MISEQKETVKDDYWDEVCYIGRHKGTLAICRKHDHCKGENLCDEVCYIGRPTNENKGTLAICRKRDNWKGDTFFLAWDKDGHTCTFEARQDCFWDHFMPSIICGGFYVAYEDATSTTWIVSAGFQIPLRHTTHDTVTNHRRFIGQSFNSPFGTLVICQDQNGYNFGYSVNGKSWHAYGLGNSLDNMVSQLEHGRAFSVQHNAQNVCISTKDHYIVFLDE
jgi:hypothetical protein